MAWINRIVESIYLMVLCDLGKFPDLTYDIQGTFDKLPILR